LLINGDTREERGVWGIRYFEKLLTSCVKIKRGLPCPHKEHTACVKWVGPRGSILMHTQPYPFYVTFILLSLHLVKVPCIFSCACSSDPHFMLLLRTFYPDMPSLTSPRSSNSFLFFIYLFLYLKILKKSESFFIFFFALIFLCF